MKEEQKIFLVTVFEGYNFGSALQAFALKRFIEINTKTKCEIVSTFENKIDTLKKRIAILFKSFSCFETFYRIWIYRRKKQNAIIYNRDVFLNFELMYLKPSFYSFKELKNISRSEFLLASVVGSDQIWSPYPLVISKKNFLSFSPKSKNISYACSLGMDYIPKYNKKVFKRYLGNISYYSVREETGKNILLKEYGIESLVCLDPVLLVGREFWETYCRHTDVCGYIFLYFLGAPNMEVLKRILNNEKLKGLKLLCINENVFGDGLSVERIHIKTVFDFASYIRDASFVITDSFHGMIFSLLFEREFIVVERNYDKIPKQSSRIVDFLQTLEIYNAYYSCKSNMNIDDLFLHDKDYKAINIKIENLRNMSKRYLIDAISEVRREA